MRQEIALYIGTSTMVFLALMFIGFVVWASGAINRFREFSQARDQYFMKRIDAVEDLIKTEFLEVINSIKKL